MTPVLWLAPGESAPSAWTEPVLRADIRGHIFGREGEDPVIATEHVWVRRRELGREVVAGFFGRLSDPKPRKGLMGRFSGAAREEGEVLAPYREGLEGALAQRAAGWAFPDVVARELMDPDTPVAVLAGGDLARLARPWLQDRAGSVELSADGASTPIQAPQVRAPRPLGRAAAKHLLGIIRDPLIPQEILPEGVLVAITSLSHGTQSVTLAPVVRALRETEPVLLLNTAPAALPDMPDHIRTDSVTLPPPRMKLVAADTLRLWASPPVADGTPPVRPGLQRLLMRVLQIDLPRLVALDAVLARAAENGRTSGTAPHLIGTTDSTFTSDFLRRRAPHHGVRRTVVQNAFVSGSARYTKPETDRLLTIDAWSSDVIASKFGVDPATMEVVGSARYAHLPALRGTTPEGPHGKAEWLARHGFSEDAHLFAFAAQPSAHSGGALAFLEAMEREFGTDTTAAFAIRLHPKEFPDVVEAIKAKLADTPLQAALDRRPIEPFLLSADAVVTEFSNVGLEAGILRKPLLILKLPGSPAFPPLDKFAIGRTVESYTDAASALRDLMEKGAEAAGFPDTADEFAEANPGLYRGDTVDAILRSIARDRDGS